MQYSIVGNDIALIMHYRALLKRSDPHTPVHAAQSHPNTQMYLKSRNKRLQIYLSA